MTLNGRSSHSESVYITSINFRLFKGFAGSIEGMFRPRIRNKM